MRRPIAVSIALLGALLSVVAVASAGSIAPSYVSASVSPRHKLQAPYKSTVTGAVHYRKCPHGTTKHNYCTDIPPGRVCTGTVTLHVRLGPDPLLADAKHTIRTARGKLSKRCTYSIRTTLPAADLTATSRYRPHQKGAYVFVSFLVRFNGNKVLAARRARRQNVVAKLTQP